MSRQWFRGMPDARGTHIFSPAELDRMIQTVVTPAVPADHQVAFVLATTEQGISAGVVFKKHTSLGDWRCEAAFNVDYTGQKSVGTSLAWSM